VSVAATVVVGVFNDGPAGNHELDAPLGFNGLEDGCVCEGLGLLVWWDGLDRLREEKERRKRRRG